MKVAIVKYNAGNVQSVIYALQRLGIDDFIVTDKESELQSADKVIFPGVGNAKSAMNYLIENELDKIIISLKQPVLGVCVGLQLLCKYSEEGDTNCLGIFNTDVKKFNPSNFKVPQMGWNNIFNLNSALFKNLPENSFVYNVHSYYANVCNETIATTDYILPYSAALHKNNFYAVQFHIEKSGIIGEKILNNFLLL